VLLYLPEGRLRRSCDAVDFADLTDATLDGPCRWLTSDELPVEVDGAERTVDVLLLPFEPDPSPAEQVEIRRRLVTVDQADEDTLHDLLAQRDALTGLEPPLLVAWLRGQLAEYGETA